MKRAASLKVKIVAALTALITSFTLQPAQAAQFLTTTSSGCNNYGMDTYQLAQAFDIPAATTLTSAQWKMYNTVAPSSAQIRFYANNSGAIGSTLLGTLSYSSWSSPMATFTGSVSLATTGRYWIRFSTTSRADPCGYIPVSTTGTPSGWSLAPLPTKESTNAGSTFLNRADSLTFLFALYGTGGGVAPTATSLSLTGSPTFTYGLATTISFSLGVAGSDGKVTFFANGKRIPSCINKSSSALSVSCSWRPPRRGSVSLTARLTPTDSGFASSISPAKNILVSNRVSKR